MATTHSRCKVISGNQAFEGKQGLSYFTGISAKSAGSRGLCMHQVTLPPGSRGKAHLHDDHETAIYVLSGNVIMWYGDQLEESMHASAGDFMYIPAGVPHLPVNASDTEPYSGLVARTDPNEQESVVLRPELDDLVAG